MQLTKFNFPQPVTAGNFLPAPALFLAKKRMMKKYILTALVTLSLGISVSHAQWMGGLTAGAAFPVGASNNAPSLSTSFTAGVRVMYLLKNSPLALSVMIDGVHWLKSEHPHRSIVPLDEKLYTSRALHFPGTVGVNYIIGGRKGWMADVYAAGGIYWRNLTCQRMAAPGVMDDMEEHGWGVACKVGLDFIYRPRFGLSVSYMALGNPFATRGDSMPAGTGPIENGVRRSQPTLDGYVQGFLSLSLGFYLVP